MEGLTLGDILTLLGIALAAGSIIAQVHALSKSVTRIEVKVDVQVAKTEKHGNRIVKLETKAEAA